MSFSNLRTQGYEFYTKVADALTGPLTVSKFLQEGVLTPEEFVAAGDLLVHKAPTWSWQSSKYPLSYLPPGKQYLVTKNVPSLMRVSNMHQQTADAENKDVELEDGEGGWTYTHANEPTQADEDISEIDIAPAAPANAMAIDEDDDDYVPEIDLSDLSIKGAEEDFVDPASAAVDNILRTRTYDLSICYDQYHQTPRVWLFGYNERGEPLKPEEVLQDISQEHVNKTVTIAAHPHTGINQAYIHPCKHAAVMKTMVQRMVESGKTPRVDQYLILFLKFIHAAIPTIEYDYTMEVAFE